MFTSPLSSSALSTCAVTPVDGAITQQPWPPHQQLERDVIHAVIQIPTTSTSHDTHSHEAQRLVGHRTHTQTLGEEPDVLLADVQLLGNANEMGVVRVDL